MKISVVLQQESVIRGIEFNIEKDELKAQINSVADSLTGWIAKRVRSAKMNNKSYLKANKPIQVRIKAGTKLVFDSAKMDAVETLGFDIKFNSLGTPKQKQMFSRKLKFAMDEFTSEFRIMDFGDDVLSAIESELDEVSVKN
jgi:hypothetical protein